MNTLSDQWPFVALLLAVWEEIRGFTRGSDREEPRRRAIAPAGFELPTRLPPERLF